MASSAPLRALLWDIQKQLHLLSEEQLYSLASSLEDERGLEVPKVTGTNEPELFEFIVDYMKSDQLRTLEDEGMSCLLIIKDKIDELKSSKGSESDMDTANNGKDVSGGSSMTEQVSGLVRLTDVTALLPRRDFKMHGGVISDASSDMSYNSVCKQIDEGLKEKFSESEIIRTVLRMIKPGNFKDMLTNKDDLTVAELKRFLKSHMRERSSTELFQELSNAKQHDKETPQQFVYRLMGLKQKIISASQHGSEFNYDKRLVQGVFLHTLYQGLNEKNGNIRSDIKPHNSDLTVTDDFILEQVTKSANEEAERQKRLSTVYKHKLLTVSSSQSQEDSEKSYDTLQKRMEGEPRANRTALMELTAQVAALTENLEKMMRPSAAIESQTAAPLMNVKVSDKPESKRRCDDCIQR